MTVRPRDVFANTTGKSQWESTTDALQAFGRNQLSSQFPTAKYVATDDVPVYAGPQSARAPVVSSKKMRVDAQHGSANAENSASAVNSPPMSRVTRLLKEESGDDGILQQLGSPYAERKRQPNPTRSPMVKRTEQLRVSGPMAEALTAKTVAVPVVAAPVEPAPLAVVEAPPAAPPAAAPAPAEADPAQPPPLALHLKDVVGSESPSGSGPSTPTLGRKLTPRGANKGSWSAKRASGAAPKVDVTGSPATKSRKLFAQSKHVESLGLRDRGSSDSILRGASNLRTSAVMEIVETETRYLLRLQGLMEARNELVRTGVVSADESRQIFGNLEQLHSLSSELHQKLVAATENFDADATLIAPVMSEHLPYLRLYEQYLCNYEDAVGKLATVCENKKAERVLKKLRGKVVTQGASLDDLKNWVAEPMQRVTRYRLLLLEAVKHTSAAHPDYKGLVQAHEECVTWLHDMNKRVGESQMKAQYAMLKNAMHEVDAERVTEEGNDKVRALLWDGMVRMLDTTELRLVGAPVAAAAAAAAPPKLHERGFSTEDLLLKLDAIRSFDKADGPQPEARKPAQAVASALPALLSANQIPQRPERESFQIDPALAKLRSTEDSVSFSSEDGDGADAMMAFLCNDVLVLAFEGDGGKLHVDSVVPLETIWVIQDARHADEIIVASPAGMRRFAPEAGPVLIKGTERWPQRAVKPQNVTQTWQAKLVEAIEQRVASNEEARRARQRCTLWVEPDGNVVVEQGFVKVAEQVTERLQDTEQHLTAMIRAASPKKKRGVLTLFSK